MVQYQQTLQTIGRGLRELTLNAKLLIGAMMVILVMSLVLVAQFSSGQTMVPLAVSLDDDSRGQVVKYLNRNSIPFEPSGTELLVSPRDQYEVLAAITDSNVISSDQIDFDKIISQDSPFLSRDQNMRRWLVAKMHVIEKMLSKMSGIRKVSIIIDEPTRRGGIGGTHTPASASVTVETNGNPLGQERADGIARTVSKSHAGLKVEQISILDLSAGRYYHPRADDDMRGGNYLEAQDKQENYYREKLENALAYIPGVNVAVQVVVDMRAVVERSRGYEDVKSGELSKKKKDIRSNSQKGGPQEPGVRPNTGLNLASRGGRTTTFEDKSTDTKNALVFPETTREIVSSRGNAMLVNASVGIPKSYLVGLFRERQGDEEATPDAQALADLVSSESDVIRNKLTPLIDSSVMEGGSQGTVDVSVYNDMAVAQMPSGGMLVGGLSVEGSGGGSGSGGFSDGSLDGIVRTVGLGGLALLSLAMMFMMVRKASVREELPSAEEIVGIPPALEELEKDLVGEATEADTPMEGVEVDDQSLRRQNMLEQINEMASNTPDELAVLLRKWIKQDE